MEKDITDKIPATKALNNLEANLDTIPAADLFAQGMPHMIEGIKRITADTPTDVSRDKDRKHISSLAAKVSRLKVKVDTAGKELVADWKAQAKVVDTARKEWRDTMDGIRDRVRAPLTEWEAQEAERVRIIGEKIFKIDDQGRHIVGLSSIEILERIERLDKANADLDEVYQERAVEAAGMIKAVRDTLTHAFDRAEASEAQAAELKALQEAEAEREAQRKAEVAKAEKEKAELQAKLDELEAKEKAREAEEAERAEDAKAEEAKRAQEAQVPQEVVIKTEAQAEEAEAQENGMTQIYDYLTNELIFAGGRSDVSDDVRDMIRRIAIAIIDNDIDSVSYTG